MLRHFLPLVLSVTTLLAGNRVDWQPLIDYTVSLPGNSTDGAPPINPFENFTHFGTDFGWMGLGQQRIKRFAGDLTVDAHGEWTGAWHSLAGLALDFERTLDPYNIHGLEGESSKKTCLHEVAINVSGKGNLRLEIINSRDQPVWTKTFLLNSEQISTHRFPLGKNLPNDLKFFNWIAESGSEVKISSIGFLLERPAMPLEEWAFRISLAKLLRCHDTKSGLTRDRAHIPAGRFDSISSTGMHALALSIAAKLEMIDTQRAIQEFQTTIETVEKLSTAHGFLPHFTHKIDEGLYSIFPGTEYSTVDTAIALQSMLLAATILEKTELVKRVSTIINRLNFHAVTDAQGWIHHGFLDDARTPLQSDWRDWGGETALVLTLEAMASHDPPRGKMSAGGRPHRGVGFIAEIQSLFYPDFDREEADLISNASWPRERKRLLHEQMAYPKDHWKGTAAAHSRIFGLSAGESGMPGAGYTANGSEVMGARWIHPHYMLMGLALSASDQYLSGLQDLDRAHLLYPMGLPENIEADLKLQNPMNGSLNAAFETLAAYHAWKKRNTNQNLIDKASYSNPLLRKGISVFYPLHPETSFRMKSRNHLDETLPAFSKK